MIVNNAEWTVSILIAIMRVNDAEWIVSILIAMSNDS